MKILKIIDRYSAIGKYTFNVIECQKDIGISKVAVKLGLNRLRKKGVIASPARGFEVILPPQYRKQGILPPEYFIDDLMKYLKRNYYISVLSAAVIYNSAHHHVQQLQVVCDKPKKNILIGNIKICFIYNKYLKDVPKRKIDSNYGSFWCATPEVMVIDLINYISYAGGIDNIVTVLEESANQINPELFRDLCLIYKSHSWIQRLGYLYELIERQDIGDVLFSIIKDKRIQPCYLDPDSDKIELENNMKWQIIINTKIEREE